MNTRALNIHPSRRQKLACLLLLFCASLATSDLRGQTSSAPAPAATEAGQQSTPESRSPEKAKEVQSEDSGYKHSAVVRSLGAKLGLSPDAAATTFEVSNFVILAALILWFLARTLPKFFRNRSHTIQKDLVDAKSATADANARLKGVEDRLGKLDEQIASMRRQAEIDAVVEEQRIKASVEEEKSKILAAAESEIAAATAQAQRQIQKFAADLVIDQAAKKLVVTAETDRLLVQSFARRLAGDESKGGQN